MLVSIRNHLVRDPIVLDLAVAIGERAALRCQLLWRHRDGARPCDQLVEGWLLRHCQCLFVIGKVIAAAMSRRNALARCSGIANRTRTIVARISYRPNAREVEF